MEAETRETQQSCKAKLGKYGLNILLALDQLWNALTGGDPDETYSSRLGRLQNKNSGIIPWWRPLPKFIAWGLEKIDPGHCQDAIEPDEGKDELFT